MAENDNPFGSLVTPDILEAKRRGAFDAEYEKANPWVRLAAEAGFKMKEDARRYGIGMTEEDAKAARTQSIMTNASKRQADLIASGKVTAEESQAAVLEDAIKAFAANGDFEQAIALTQPLNTLKKQAAERRKLTAEAANLEAKPELTEAQTQAKLAEIGQKEALAQAAVDRANAAMQNAATMAQWRENQNEIARLRLELDRLKLDKAKAAGVDKSSTTYFKQKLATDDRVLAAADATNLMAIITEEAIKDPGAFTQAGPWSTTIQGLASSAKAFMQGEGYSLDATQEGADVKGLLVKRNISDAKLQSAVLDLAFAFARVRDPGGRLSNQDVTMAMDIVTGGGDPRARLAVLQQNYANMIRQTDNFLRVRGEQGVEIAPSARAAYEASMARYKAARQPKAVPDKNAPAPTAKVDAEGWTLLPNGLKVREKPGTP